MFDTDGQRSHQSTAPLGRLLGDYYAYHGWSEEGIPTQEKLKELGFDTL
jgi:aldehyde:ferredoxin oxidoreductase